jgi:hypothetical protein
MITSQASSHARKARGGGAWKKAAYSAVGPLLRVAALALVALTTFSAWAQGWQVGAGTSADMTPTEAHYFFSCAPPGGACSIAGPTAFYNPYLQWDMAWVADAYCDSLPVAGDCGSMSARGNSLLTLDGVGSNTIDMKWDSLAYTDYDCCYSPDGYYEGWGWTTINASINLVVPWSGTVYFRGSGISATWARPEVSGPQRTPPLPPPVPGPPGPGPRDDFAAGVGTLTITHLVDGAPVVIPVVTGELDLIDINGVLQRGFRGSFGADAGDVITITIYSYTDAYIFPPPRTGFADQYHYPVEYDSASSAFGGRLTLSSSAPPPPADECLPPAIEFSVDIGSDTELSDPTPDFNEVFDPGDMYRWKGPPLPFGGANGIRDDVTLFGFDPLPTPPDGAPPATGAPTCSAKPPPVVTAGWFDLDDSDSTDFDITTLPGYSPTAPFPAPIARFPSQCVHRAEYLIISYNDDGPTHYVGSPGSCDVPSTAASSMGDTYGSAAFQDEVLGLLAMPGGPPVAAVTYPLLDEAMLHVSLGPPPPPPFGPVPQDQDDDVDGLDLTPWVGGQFLCWQQYFTADHEATGGLPTDLVYRGSPAVPVLSQVIHLGLPPGTDIDGFEFVWTYTTTGAEMLTLLFSVKPDDPLTPLPLDESGGRNPAMIYASYLTGFSFPFLSTALPDDVDAIAAWCMPVTANMLRGDVNCDGVVNFGDINPFVLLLSNPTAWAATYPDCPMLNGDINGDGSVNFGDINPFVSLLSGGG